MAHIVIVALIVLGALGLYLRQQFQTVQKAAASSDKSYVRPPLPDSSRLKCAFCAGTGRSNFFSGRSMERVSCRNCRGMGWVDNPAYEAIRRAQSSTSTKQR